MKDLLNRIIKSNVVEGRGDKLSPADVDRGQLQKGIKVEYEHIGDGKEKPADSTVTKFIDGEYANIIKQDLEKLVKAQSIALDHLAELPDYYDRLDKMEKAGKGTSESISEGDDNPDIIQRKLQVLLTFASNMVANYTRDQEVLKKMAARKDERDLDDYYTDNGDVMKSTFPKEYNHYEELLREHDTIEDK